MPVTLHPLARELVRSHLRRELAPQIGFAAAVVRVWSLPDEEIDCHAETAAAKVGAALPPDMLAATEDAGRVGAAFDGHILKEILAWAESPRGKAILSLVVTALSLLLLFG